MPAKIVMPQKEVAPEIHATRRRLPVAWLLLFGMVCAALLIDAVLPLHGLWFSDVLLTSFGSWPLLPTHLLFPGLAVTPGSGSEPPAIALGWQEAPLVLGVFLLSFVIYLLALRYLPGVISRRYILASTLLLGVIFLLIPIATSPDVFSYIAYARMGTLYHLNPLTAIPTDIRGDPVYPYLYWIDQPSAYGPTWVALSLPLQWLTLPFGTNNLAATLLAFRLLGLLTHLGSTWLVWLIGGRLQSEQGALSPEQRRRATLAFAWNPLLLLEACTNAHNDSALLLLILLALWFLVRERGGPRSYLLASATLAIAVCLKLNAALLFPGLLLYFWTQSRGSAKVVKATALFGGLIVLLYAPFWQGGVLLNVLHTNPSTSRNINTLADFLAQSYNSIMALLGFPLVPTTGSAAEHLTHTLSVALFLVSYAFIGWRAFRDPERIKSPTALIRWLALAWLLYCALGSPWYWPWYLTTFFGLYALIEAADDHTPRFSGFLGLPLTVRLLAFSMLTVYIFYIWGIHASFIPWLPGFAWGNLRGLWAWVLPALAILCYRFSNYIAQKSHLPHYKPRD